MEKNKEIEELDFFIKKHVKEIPKEQPSIDFTTSIMDTILKEENEVKITDPQELITKKTWFLIFVFLLIMTFIASKIVNKQASYIIDFRFDYFNKLELFQFSSSIVYSVSLFGVMLIAQTIILKTYFEKRV